MPSLPNSYLFLVSPPKLCMYFVALYMCHMPCPSHHAIWLAQPDDNWPAVQPMKLLMTQFSPISCQSLPLRITLRHMIRTQKI